MAITEEVELIQGKTWQIDGTILDVNGVPISWADYGVRGKARTKYSAAAAAWDWVCTTGASGNYTAFLGAEASKVILAGCYVSDIEIYSLTDTDLVYEALRMNITVLPEATK